MIGGFFKLVLSILIFNWIYDEVATMVPALTDLSDQCFESLRLPTHEDFDSDSLDPSQMLASVQEGLLSVETDIRDALDFSAAGHGPKAMRRTDYRMGSRSEGFREFQYAGVRTNVSERMVLERF